jgi:hypothetical protein
MFIDYQRRLNFESKQEVYDLLETLGFFYLTHKDDLENLSFDFMALIRGLNSVYESYSNFPSCSDRLQRAKR